MKYQVIQIRKFLEGSLKDLEIEHKSLSYKDRTSAEMYVKNCVGLTVAGGWLGPQCVILKAWIVTLPN